MKNIKNLSIIDRVVRLFLSEILFLVWFFWLAWTFQIVAFVFSFIFLVTWFIWYCGLYKWLWFDTTKYCNNISNLYKALLVILFILIAVIGSYYSIFFTKKIFLEEYNSMNNYYKQTLFNTWKNNREESISNYDLLVSEYKKFSEKYMEYKPYVLKKDELFNFDLKKISFTIFDLKEEIYTWDLQKSHLTLEEIRPIFQEILKRNNFSMLAISLVDFHDVMEKVIDAADDKNIELLFLAYTEADEKLKAVENEANDDEIKAIRNSLEEIKTLAENSELDKLSDKAQELKTNFVKVYLKRG